MTRPTYAFVLANRAHYKAIGQTDIWLDDKDADLPWSAVTSIETGGSYRLGVPVSVRCKATTDGLTFSWHTDFETQDANGTGRMQFDTARLINTMTRLPVSARRQFAAILRTEVLPKALERQAEIFDAYKQQVASAAAVADLIGIVEDVK